MRKKINVSKCNFIHQGRTEELKRGGENTEKNQLLLLNPLQKSPLNAYDIHLNK